MEVMNCCADRKPIGMTLLGLVLRRTSIVDRTTDKIGAAPHCLQNINFPAACPGAVNMIFRHHPNSRPESCAQRAARTKFYFSVAKREKPTCIDFGGSIGNPLTKLNRRGLTKRTDRKSVIPNEQILCIIPIILLFIVSPTGGKWGSVLGNRSVADPNIPFGSIQSSAAKGILPSQLIKGRHENHSLQMMMDTV